MSRQNWQFAFIPADSLVVRVKSVDSEIMALITLHVKSIGDPSITYQPVKARMYHLSGPVLLSGFHFYFDVTQNDVLLSILILKSRKSQNENKNKNKNES